MSDDSDSDVPLSMLAARKKQKKPVEEEEEEEEFEESSEGEQDDDDDDDEEDASDDGAEEEEELDDEDDDSDSDDIPLSQLKSPKKKAAASPKKKKAASSTKKAPAKKKTDTKKKTKAASKKKTPKKSSSTVSSKSSTNRPNLPSFALYDATDKGLLVQRVLCRWWYVTSWPDPESLPSAPPKGYDALNGFPGMYVCTSGASIGKLIDKRDKSTAPNFANYMRKSAEELQAMLLKAITEQKRQLVKTEGPGTATEKELNQMGKWARKLNCKKVDKDGDKALKAVGIKI